MKGQVPSPFYLSQACSSIFQNSVFKYSCTLILILCALEKISAQTDQPAHPDLLVLSSKWSANNLALANSLSDTDPFEANNDANQIRRDRREEARVNQERAREGKPPVAPRVRVKAPAADHTEPVSKFSFTYRVKVRNTGNKDIRLVVWNYVFLDPATNSELARHVFTSETDLEAGATAKLASTIFAPPVRTIDANSGKAPERYIERVEITGIQYADGSVWSKETN